MKEAKQMTMAQAVGAASHTPGGFSTAVRSVASQYRVGLIRFESGRVFVFQGGVFGCSSRMTGNLQVRFLESRAPAMAPGYSTMSRARTDKSSGESNLTSSRLRYSMGRLTGHKTSERSLENLKRGTSMKKTLMWCLIGLVSLGSAAWSQAQQTGGIEKAVAALEEQWLQSQKTNSPDLVTPLLAERLMARQ